MCQNGHEVCPSRVSRRTMSNQIVATIVPAATSVQIGVYSSRSRPLRTRISTATRKTEQRASASTRVAVDSGWVIAI